jgi:hypothetical protein
MLFSASDDDIPSRQVAQFRCSRSGSLCARLPGASPLKTSGFAARQRRHGDECAAAGGRPPSVNVQAIRCLAKKVAEHR